MAKSSVAAEAATAAATTTPTAAATAKAATKAAAKASAAAAATATATECTWLSRGCNDSTQKSTAMRGLNDKVLLTQAAHLLFYHSNECHKQDCSLLMERLWINVSG
jgi:hypothetical protein